MMHPPHGYPPPQEQGLYQDHHGVLVTTGRFVVGATMYPIRGITAVQVVQLPSSKGAANTAALGFFVSLCLVFVLGPVALLMALGLFVLALYLNGAARGSWALRVWTAGGQLDAVVAQDQARINQIAAALHRAVTGM